MASDAGAIESILFEIARTMDYVRHDPLFPESQDCRAGATGHIKAKPAGRLMDMDLIEWKGGTLTVIGGDWYEIPSLLLEFAKLLAKTHGPVKSFRGQFSPQNVLTLQARGKAGVLGEWILAYTPKARNESPELLQQADDVSGVPECIVGALRELNDRLRNRLFPLKPKAGIPVKFWNIADPVVQWTAMQHLYLELLRPFGYDDAAVPPLPKGYETICKIFHAFEEIDNEGFETAIENLGSDYRDPLVAELHRVGLPALADLFHNAWLAHPEGPQPDAMAFETITATLGKLIDEDESTLDAIHRYVASNGRLFEQTA
jgi:hypothetical protein